MVSAPPTTVTLQLMAEAHLYRDGRVPADQPSRLQVGPLPGPVHLGGRWLFCGEPGEEVAMLDDDRLWRPRDLDVPAHPLWAAAKAAEHPRFNRLELVVSPGEPLAGLSAAEREVVLVALTGLRARFAREEEETRRALIGRLQALASPLAA